MKENDLPYLQLVSDIGHLIKRFRNLLLSSKQPDRNYQVYLDDNNQVSALSY